MTRLPAYYYNRRTFMKNAKQQYEYYRKKLLKEAQRGGLTSQEYKLLKLVDRDATQLTDKEISKQTSKVKAEFKRVRKTKKYKAERRLRNQFYRLKGRYEKEELERMARRRLRNLPPAEDQLRGAYFKNLSYEKLIKEGITRHIDNKVVRFTGFEAVKTQIKSLEEASDPERKKQAYIKIYIDNLKANGIPEAYETIDANGEPITRNLIQELEDYLQSLPPKTITFALDLGYIQSIQMYYVMSQKEIEEFADKVDYWTSDKRRAELEYHQTLIDEQTQKMVRVIRKERELIELAEKTPKKVNKNF